MVVTRTDGKDPAKGARLTPAEPQASDESQHCPVSLRQNVISGRHPPLPGFSSWLAKLNHAWKHAYQDSKTLPTKAGSNWYEDPGDELPTSWVIQLTEFLPGKIQSTFLG